MQGSILLERHYLQNRRPILVREGGHHCIFLLPIKKNSKPPGFTTLAPSVSNLENEGSFVLDIFVAVLWLYGGLQPHLSNLLDSFAGNAWASHTKLGSLSLLMSTVYKFGFDLTSPEQHSIIFRLVEIQIARLPSPYTCEDIGHHSYPKAGL